MSQRGRHNLLMIEKDDQMSELPDHWRENNEAIADAFDRMEDEIIELKEEIRCLKRDRSSL